MKSFLVIMVALLFVSSPVQGQLYLKPFTVSSFSTEFHSWNARGDNVKLTAHKINGTVILPRQTFSYNETVGERTEEAGFKRAGAIRGGRLVKELGGGACQLAGTLHAAALYAGLTIVEAHRHSRASKYIRPGLDATVSWSENKDLKIYNNYPTAVYIYARESKRGRLLVTIESIEKPFKVKIKFITKKKIPFETKVREVLSKDIGYYKEKEKGTLGFHMWRIRSIYDDLTGERLTVDKQFMFYPPSPRIIEIGIRE